jgi:hypothetical protein
MSHGDGLRFMGRALFGANPWPSTGRLGHVAAGLMMCEMLVFLAILFFPLVSGFPMLVRTDFIAYFTAGTLIANGESHLLYDGERQLATQLQFLTEVGIPSPGLITFVNPPLLAAIMAAFVPFGVVGGAWLWFILTFALPAAVLLAVGKQGARRAGWWRSCLLLLCFAPFIESVYFGQMAAIMLPIFGGWFLLSRANRPILAGLALSLLLLKPQYLPVMLLFLAWKRQWTQLVGFAFGAAIQVVATVLVMLSSGHALTLEALLPYMRFGGEPNVVVWLQLNLRMAIWHLLPQLDATSQLVVLAICTVVAVVAFLLLVGRSWRPRSRGFVWQALALFVFVPLTAYHNNLLHLYLTLPVMVALLVTDEAALADRRWYGPVLALLLGIPSIALVLGTSLSPYFYIMTAWAVALVALAMGIDGLRRYQQLERHSPGLAPAAALHP